LAAVASTLAAGAFGGLSSLLNLITALVIAFGHSVLVGLPAALYWRHRRWTHVLSAIGGGFLVGATPIGILLVGSNLLSSLPIISDLLTCLEIAGIGGLLGAPGGLAFWLTLRAFGEFR
jgi:hypothetical protein